MSPSEFLAFVSGIGSGAAIANTELAIAILRCMFAVRPDHRPEINIKLGDKTKPTTVQVTTIIDLGSIPTVRKA